MVWNRFWFGSNRFRFGWLDLMKHEGFEPDNFNFASVPAWLVLVVEEDKDCVQFHVAALSSDICRWFCHFRLERSGLSVFLKCASLCTSSSILHSAREVFDQRSLRKMRGLWLCKEWLFFTQRKSCSRWWTRMLWFLVIFIKWCIRRCWRWLEGWFHLELSSMSLHVLGSSCLCNSFFFLNTYTPYIKSTRINGNFRSGYKQILYKIPKIKLLQKLASSTH